ncbi:MAG TPA: hypothetical protein VHT70_00460 [Candidatus Saccharimonadales bacterium]|jgi:hypothetical protein|nr:hypothetical protein [Candidatus Saccharimonadales bacterium]
MATFTQNYRAARGLMAAFATLVVLVAGIIALIMFVVHKTAGYRLDDVSKIGAHVCDGGEKIENAANYTGTAPHKMRIVEESSVIQTKPNLTDYSDIGVTMNALLLKTNPQQAQKQYQTLQSLHSNDVSDTQLVGCISRSNETKTSQTCAYDTGTLAVYDTKYTLNIYTAKTHKLIKSTTLPTTPLSQFACPSSVYYDPANKRQYVPYDPNSLITAVQSYAS